VKRRLSEAILSDYNTFGEFAAAVGVSPAYVSRVIRGSRRLPPARRREWCSLLGWDEAELFRGRDGDQ
jgi:transcriptional regulator with XRE-family HTH domain